MSSKQPKKNYGSTEDANASNEHDDDDVHNVETQRIGSGRRDKRSKHHTHYTPTKKTDVDHHVNNESSTDTTSDYESNQPLVPSSIEDFSLISHNNGRRRASSWSLSSIRHVHVDDLNSLAESVFSDIRSDSTATRLSICNDAERYGHCSAYQRAFPERSFALIVTLIFEMPTLFLISGGSDQLCKLIGRHKYTTLIALLPIISAISGNVGLQASTLTTRAISHQQVRVDNYGSWLWKEITAALYLGVGIGLVTASISLWMGGYSVPFAISIFTAQFIGILTAGCTGTLAPLLFTFIFQRDSGKWGGPLETAVQDVVGSFAMIVITYKIMLYCGPFELEPNDMC